jgi:hypothetical protein
MDPLTSANMLGRAAPAPGLTATGLFQLLLRGGPRSGAIERLGSERLVSQ